MAPVLRLLLALVLVAAPAPAGPPASPQTAYGRGGAVAAEEGTAARVGLEILKKGGNAADAAVATAFALAVTWPEAGNLGGGGFWLSRDAGGRILVVDFREVAPRAARRDLFSRPAPDGKVPSSVEGPLATGVPGTVAGLALAHQRAGHLPWKAVVEPAERLAREGFVVTENVSRSIAAHIKELAADPETAAILAPGGAPPVPGTLWRQPALARTLAAIRERGPDGFYRGRVAREIEAGQRAAGGLINRGDLGRYQARIRRSLHFRFHGTDVYTTPAPSSGAALAEIALLAEAAGLQRLRQSDAAAAHLLSEIEKRAFLDRNRFLGDPAWRGVRERHMLDRARLARLAGGIDPTRATASRALAASRTERSSTTHLSVADGSGAVVAVTTTLNDSFGNKRVATGLGFLWNNEMDDFSSRPGQPNLYGLVQGEVNAVAPGKRMLSSMCPAIAVVPGRGVFAWGTPGGSTIPTTSFQVMLELVVRGQPLSDAIAAPRFHQQDFPDVVEVEKDAFEPSFAAALEEMGHSVKTSARDPVPGKIGRVHAVQVSRSGRTGAVADPRRQGTALVVQPDP